MAVVLSIVGIAAWQLGTDDTRSNGVATAVAMPSTSTPSSMVSTTVPVNDPYATLSKVIPTELDGYDVDTGARATGSLDFEAAVAAETDTQAERALLATRHYQAGYARSFVNGTTHVYMAVYDFRDADDAALYLEDGMITLYGKGAGTYDVDRVPGGRGFSIGIDNEDGASVVHGVAFAKQSRFVLTFTRSSSTSTPAQAADFAVQLYGRA